jgi:hypothetical protein
MPRGHPLEFTSGLKKLGQGDKVVMVTMGVVAIAASVGVKRSFIVSFETSSFFLSISEMRDRPSKPYREEQ